MGGVLILVLALIGCGSPEPAPTPMPPPPARAKAKTKAGKPSVRAKAKTGNMVHGKAKGKAKAPRGKAPTRRPPAIGGSGEVKGHLVLTAKESEAKEGAPAKPRTEANMVLAWGEGETAKAWLGEVDGTCTSVEPKPVGAEGREQTPLWTVSCAEEGSTSELYILQAKSLLMVVRGTPGGPKGMVYKPVRRVPLHSAAKLVRSDEPAPTIEEEAAAPAPAPSPVEPAAPSPEPTPSPAPAPAPVPAPE